ncbi:hypothetical protein [Clostridium grantii]|uniref:Uncharacterized protein n=1 Tax=Clostridium grantii DSM 8605 TaxID=1121316 RepID=A0A1M5W6W7_9CLOT|nr:hypothetical protein [Clostridium grantii]SHH83168.1 hypothetical protein SAMN02745207_02712 [Clostridium grantii DSM 8605]
MPFIKVNKEEAISELQNIISEANKINELITSEENKQISDFFSEWQECVEELLKNIIDDSNLVSEFESETIYLENSFSKYSTKNEVTKAISRGIKFLKRLREDISKDVYKDKKIISNEIPYEIANIIIRRILQNFHKHIEAMYQNTVHGSARILKCDLDKIKIGNEYDVQRMLYSIIKPIFPLARLEVVDDTKYNSIRYDICIDEYDVVIEVKCTRNSMSERHLTEELGSDIFHYQARNLFFFIYDKEKIIRNKDAFIKSYTKKDTELNKNIETIVIQPILL